MALEQIARQAMDYLDSVGVAADYVLYERMLIVIQMKKVTTSAFTT